MNKSKIFKLAHSVRAEFNTFSQALIFAWAKYKLQTRLTSGVVSFDFIKKSTGELRKANGTLDFQIPYVPSSNTAWYIQKFKDVDLDQWRCLDIRTLIKIYIL
tara:strand:+ start:9163 stop:9471 length:309 start_codon:yes stop_codon:yes gene_type:complete